MCADWKQNNVLCADIDVAEVSRILPVLWGLFGARAERCEPRLAYTVSRTRFISSEGWRVERGESRGSTGRDSDRSAGEKKRRSSSNLSKTSKDWLRGGGGGLGFPENKKL